MQIAASITTSLIEGTIFCPETTSSTPPIIKQFISHSLKPPRPRGSACATVAEFWDGQSGQLLRQMSHAAEARLRGAHVQDAGTATALRRSTRREGWRKEMGWRKNKTSALRAVPSLGWRPLQGKSLRQVDEVDQLIAFCVHCEGLENRVSLPSTRALRSAKRHASAN